MQSSDHSQIEGLVILRSILIERTLKFNAVVSITQKIFLCYTKPSEK